MPRKATEKETTSEKENLKELRKDVDARLTELKAELDDIQRSAMKTLSEKPLLALGIAFVAGMAVGIALTRSSD